MSAPPNETNIIHSQQTQYNPRNAIKYMEDSYLPLAQQQKYAYRLKERKIACINIEKDEHITTYYTMYKIMGKGTYGIVYAARENNNNSVWAIKILTKKEGKLMNTFEREIEILKFVDHPNIIRLNCIVESPNSLYLVVDLCDGVLSDLFKQRHFLTEVETRTIIKELSSAVSYLHKNGVVHRDIKMENILLKNDDAGTNTSKITTKLTDFGLSTVKTGPTYQDMLHDRCGTFVYMAPEIIIKRSYSQQCDVWAIGVLLFALLSGEYPFVRTTENATKDAIVSEDPNYKILKVDSLNSDCVTHLIQRLLDKDPAHRSTAIEILDHPWIREQPLNQLKSGNVLDMMAQWREELTIQSSSDTPSVSKTAKVVSEDAQKVPGPFLLKTRRTSHKNSMSVSLKSIQKSKKNGINGKLRSVL